MNLSRGRLLWIILWQFVEDGIEFVGRLLLDVAKLDESAVPEPHDNSLEGYSPWRCFAS